MLLSVEPQSGISAYWAIPFALMLASVAIFPIFYAHFWDKNRNKLLIAAILSLPVILFLLKNGHADILTDTVLFDYLPFVVLLGTLFVITGGVYVDGDIEAKPSVNTTMMAIGAVLASFIGTTGATMLMIRPLISTNTERKFKTHTLLFFIAIVANCGGLMTPLGDPPLFVMYLRGAPFFWFFKMAFEWTFVNAILLTLYYFVDKSYYKKEPEINIQRDKANIKDIRIHGRRNFYYLLGVILAVAFINKQFIPAMEGNNILLKYLREIVLVFLAFLSLVTSPQKHRKANNFSWGPITEVAFLFAGIFITMIPCIVYLKANAMHLGVTTPTQFYYASGLLSSFLDNTPTAVTFHSLALGLNQSIIHGGNFVAGIPENLLRAICLGSVMFGSITYIGNGPNFMVKSIAEENGIKMPHFFKYMYTFSLIVLLPVYIITDIIFL